MSTRSFIAAQDPDGGYTSIYCHHDGYVEGVGATLAAHYTDPERVRGLLALGSISSLGDELGERHDCNWSPWSHMLDRSLPTPTPEQLHQYEHWTTAYHRDRGDPWEDTQPRRSATLEELLRRAARGCGEYVYVFQDGTWTVYEGSRAGAFGLPIDGQTWAPRPLADALASLGQGDSGDESRTGE